MMNGRLFLVLAVCVLGNEARSTRLEALQRLRSLLNEEARQRPGPHGSHGPPPHGSHGPSHGPPPHGSSMKRQESSGSWAPPSGSWAPSAESWDYDYSSEENYSGEGSWHSDPSVWGRKRNIPGQHRPGHHGPPPSDEDDISEEMSGSGEEMSGSGDSDDLTRVLEALMSRLHGDEPAPPLKNQVKKATLQQRGHQCIPNRPNPCQNGGWCDDGFCHCPYNFEGPHCENRNRLYGPSF